MPMTGTLSPRDLPLTTVSFMKALDNMEILLYAK
jgi:hypothetical protein